MTTNYPTSIDTFVNPTSNDSLNSPSHSQQHTNLNDAMVAVQTKLGYGNANHVGMDLISSLSFVNQATVIFDNVFNATYDDYVLKVDLTVAANSAFNMALRSAGSTLGGSTYSCSYWYLYLKGASSGQPYYSGTYFAFHQANVCRGFSGNININSPFANSYTNGTHHALQYDASNVYPYSFQGGFYDENSRSADGFVFNTPSSTMTGTIRIYGLRNS